MKYNGLQFSNASEKEVVIDVEGFIGWDPYDAPENQVNTKEKMKAELKKLANLKAETIVVNINSYGGDVNHGISIHDLLAENKAKIITKVNGMTASAATIIAVAGDERHMSDNALFLVHNASTIGWGDKNDIKTMVADLELIDERIANIYSKVTGKDKAEILDLMNEEKGRGRWLTSDEAKDFGFVTDVFEPRKAAAYFSNDILKRYNLPTIPGNENNQAGSSAGIAKQIIDEIKEFFTPKNNLETKIDHKNSTQMEKQFLNVNKAIGVESLEATEDGVYLNEEQLGQLDAAIEQGATDAAALATATTAQTEAEAAQAIAEDELATANQTIATLQAEIADLKKKPGAESAKAVKENDKIVDEKDGNVSNDSKTFIENMQAVASEFLK